MDINTLHNNAIQALNMGEFKQAHQYLMAILQQDKYFADAYFLMAMIASAHNNAQKAVQLIEQSIKLSPKNTEYLAQLAKQYALTGDHTLAKQYADEATKLLTSKTSPLTFDTLGVAYSKIGLHNEAIPLFKQAVEVNSNNHIFHYNLAISQTFVGDFIGAEHSHKKVIKLSPKFSKSHAALSNLMSISAENNNIESLTALYNRLEEADEHLNIGHALAREHEALGNFQQAFHYLTSAKQLKLKFINYQFAEDQKVFIRLHEHFNSARVAKFDGGFPSYKAHFVVGMPRSGTTLVERILSGHSDVSSAGELGYIGALVKSMGKSSTQRILDTETIDASSNIDFKQLGYQYIEQVKAVVGTNEKFVDKMPLNVLYVGFILQTLPQAKIVCLDRNPLDTIMSNFRQLFTANSGSYNYAYDLITTTQYYIEFYKLSRLWQKLFPDNFYIVNYEKLVNTPEIEAKKLIEFCDLDWQESCLTIEKNTAPVATASAVQVRSPISNKSIGNWKKYENYLKEVKDLLDKENLVY